MKKHSHIPPVALPPRIAIPVFAALCLVPCTVMAATALQEPRTSRAMAQQECVSSGTLVVAGQARAAPTAKVIRNAPSYLEIARKAQLAPASAAHRGAKETAGQAPRASSNFAANLLCSNSRTERNQRLGPERNTSAMRKIPPSQVYDSTMETQAVLVRKTRFDSSWRRVSRQSSASIIATELQRANIADARNETELLSLINRWVNKAITYTQDNQNYRERDYWATAEQTLTRRRGDCEDYAIAKMQMLRTAGISPDRMKLVLLRDLVAKNDHAVLLVTTDDGPVILDNSTDRLYDGGAGLHAYAKPVFSFSAAQSWVHGYRVQKN